MRASTLLDEFHRFFFRESRNGVWLVGLEKPMPLLLPPAEQLQHVVEHAYFADCNESFARMHGFEGSELVGVRLPELFVISDPLNMSILTRFLASGFRIYDAVSHGRDRHGHSVYSITTCIGIVEREC